MYDLEEIPVKPPRPGGKTGFGDMGNYWEIKNTLAVGWGCSGTPLDRREQETHTGVLDIPKCVQGNAPLIQPF